MSRNFIYILAVLFLVLLRLLVNDLHYDQWLLSAHCEHAAAFVAGLRDNPQFQAFIGGWVFPVFILLVFTFWIVEEDKSRISTQFILLPLAYIPFSIVGFTLVHAEFSVSYLITNPLIILTFGYAYILLWAGLVALLSKLHLVD